MRPAVPVTTTKTNTHHSHSNAPTPEKCPTCPVQNKIKMARTHVAFLVVLAMALLACSSARQLQKVPVEELPCFQDARLFLEGLCDLLDFDCNPKCVAWAPPGQVDNCVRGCASSANDNIPGVSCEAKATKFAKFYCGRGKP